MNDDRTATNDGPLYPDVHVALVGEDGNAFAILGRVRTALRRAGHGDVVDEFTKEATRRDYPEGMTGYDHLLCTCMRWVDCD